MPKSLSEKLSEVARKSAPNLMEPEIAKTEDEEVVPDIRDVVENPATRNKLVRLITSAHEISNEMAQLKKQLDPMKTEIKNLVSTAASSNKFFAGDVRVNRYSQIRKKLDPMKLRANGVSQAVIDASMTESTSWSLKLSGPGMEDGDE
jgi:hypothetical protein